jgi:radical SAM superfamily enzyme YgiQ (UPF0313 family)
MFYSDVGNRKVAPGNPHPGEAVYFFFSTFNNSPAAAGTRSFVPLMKNMNTSRGCFWRAPRRCAACGRARPLRPGLGVFGHHASALRVYPVATLGSAFVNRA